MNARLIRLRLDRKLLRVLASPRRLFSALLQTRSFILIMAKIQTMVAAVATTWVH